MEAGQDQGLLDSIDESIPGASGLYDPDAIRDACGVGFIADITGKKSRFIIDQGLEILKRLEHRGAVGADPLTGDGAGLQMQIPDRFFRRVVREDLSVELPEYGRYAIGFIYLPKDPTIRAAVQNIIEKVVVDEGQHFIGWRNVPTNPDHTGESARKTMPVFRQCFIGASDDFTSNEDFERKLYLIRRVIDHRVRAEHDLKRSQYYVPSFSSRTINYKGMLMAEQLPAFYPDLRDPEMESAYTLIHMRFSTNTFPTWDLAHPFRMIAHNGEINALRGNMNWMAARQMVMESPTYGKDLRRMLPIIMEGQSDSATFDSVVELLYMAGRSLPHSIMMMIPEAWSKQSDMSADRRGFYEYHATLMEPWDGPAAVAFSDGNLIGATLDRNGLRPARYIITKDNIAIMTSEVGAIPVDPSNIAMSGRLRPGRMFLIDLQQGRILDDEQIKTDIVARQPYREWVEKHMIRLENLPEPTFVHQPDHSTIIERQRAFGYTTEDVITVMKPMAEKGEEPTGSMGEDVSLAILSSKPQPLFRYFKQLFAQVTNPPIDPIREELVMELTSYVGPEGNLLDEQPEYAHRVELRHPILTNTELEKIRNIKAGAFHCTTVSILFDPDQPKGMRNRLDQICEEIAEAVRRGVNLVILSDRGVSEKQAAIPSLLAVAGVHHYLIRSGLRTKTGLLIESGEPREVAHFAMLVGYGANGINPYLAFETIHDLHREGLLPAIKDEKDARKNYIKAIGKGMLKIFSKMGISTLQSYCGAQIFEAIGLDSELVSLYFTGTRTVIEGLSLEMLEEETTRRHQTAYDSTASAGELSTGGVHYWRKDSEEHLWRPSTIHLLQHSTQNNNFETYKKFSSEVHSRDVDMITLRSLLDFAGGQKPISVDEVEPATEIVKRFQTGAMSFGSISWETHTNLAIAMNELGGKSNTGEGGEDSIRFHRMADGKNMRSAIKQVASGRFGVTANYLVNADDIQIKMAQGAKPGEGGQLPGFKIDRIVAKLRHSTPGVTLISPPPHHDIYSIEDLAQLIFDLKNVNPTARISVKLVSCAGVGTVAAGVAKAHADHILISGHDGGTGASPVSSIHYAGTPWEIGLSETHQTLVAEGLRDRVYLAVDGKLMTGRDVVIGALLGAEEFGFATGAMITQGCIMMRKCHLNTCPVGVATQDPELRRRFFGKPDYLIRYMMFMAEEVRGIMAQLGFRSFNELVGQQHSLQFTRPKDHWKARGIDMSRILQKPTASFGTGLFRTKDQDHRLNRQLDFKLIEQAAPALDTKQRVTINMPITNEDRTVGAMLSGEVAKRYGEEGLPDDTIHIEMAGYAGQSFGAFLMKGVTLRLEGQGNDYLGKGMCGGRLIVRTAASAAYDPAQNILIGNTCIYGATSGELYINGVAGERFAVRNSGVHAVVEGVGDHGCEYMTGGRVVVLGETGRNFGAGMSGGIAYVWDPDNRFRSVVNAGMVDLEPLEDASEVAEVKQLVERHRTYTGSKRADFILQSWDAQLPKFVKVMPGEYKLALQRLEEERLADLGDDKDAADGK